MLPSAPLVMTIELGGAGFTKCSVIHKTMRTSSRNGPSVSARSRHEIREILKLGRIGLRTLVKRAVGSPTRVEPGTCGLTEGARKPVPPPDSDAAIVILF